MISSPFCLLVCLNSIACVGSNYHSCCIRLIICIDTSLSCLLACMVAVCLSVCLSESYARNRSCIVHLRSVCLHLWFFFMFPGPELINQQLFHICLICLVLLCFALFCWRLSINRRLGMAIPTCFVSAGLGRGLVYLFVGTGRNRSFCISSGSGWFYIHIYGYISILYYTILYWLYYWVFVYEWNEISLIKLIDSTVLLHERETNWATNLITILYAFRLLPFLRL